MTPTVKIQKLRETAEIPAYQTVHSAGADIYACLDSEMVLKPAEITMVPTGFSMEIPEGFEAQVRPRSGLAAKGVTVANAPGTIDSDYRGEVKVILVNLGKTEFTIRHHDRIAQMIVAPVSRAKYEIAEELSETKRGAGGFGSTGLGVRS